MSDEFEKSQKALIESHKEHYGPASYGKLSQIKESVDTYVFFAKKEFYKSSVSVKPDEYFSQGTKIITQIISLYDDNSKAIMEDSKGWL